MNMIRRLGLAVALLVSTQVAMASSISNMGFESGMTGWTVAGTGGLVTSDTQFSPTFGDAVFSGNNSGYISGASSISRIASITAGDTIDFMWRFIAGDYLPYNDLSFFVGNTYVQLASVATVGNYGDSGWQYFSWVSPTTYVGPVLWGIANVGDNLLSSTLLLDATVPLPGAALLFGSALLGAGALRRKQQAAAKKAALATA